MTTIRTAIVGCGAIAHWHLDAIDRAGAPITVIAAIDPDEGARDGIADRTGAAPYASLAAAFAGAGTTPRSSRSPTTSTKRWPRGPRRRPARDAREAAGADHRREQRILADRRVRRARCSWSRRTREYWPEVLIVRDLIADGAIGDVVTARAATFFPALGDFYGGTRPWRFDRAAAGGGVVIDTGSHWLRPLRVWLGEVDEVVAALGYPHPDMEGESLCRALLRFDSGTVATFDAMLMTGAIANQPLFTVTGTKGECTIEGSGWVKLHDGSDWKGTKVGEHGGYLLSYEAESPTSRPRCCRHAPRGEAGYALGEPASRSRCTAPRRRNSGRRCGSERCRRSTSPVRTSS